LNEENKTWRSYGIAETDPKDILRFGSTQLTVRIVRGRLLDEIDALRAARVLEIGAGTCHISYLMKASGKDQSFVVATDVSTYALHAGKKLRDLFHYSLDGYVCCDSTRLPFRDQSFGFVFGSAVLHHLEKPGNACSEIRRVLQARGKYIGLEGVVYRKLRPLVRIMTGAHYRVAHEGVREDMYDFDSWSRLFRQVGMTVSIDPLVFPAAYRELIGARIVPRAYRPRFKLRYPYERLLASLPQNMVKSLMRTLFPGSVIIRAMRPDERIGA
jgi:ubiquinone/menaquinone biosynthesis C-methylase UbiE